MSQDYIHLIETYVLERWEAGVTTLVIKDELLLKKWPPAMIEVVIDRLVKQKVEQQQGQLSALEGPDFWHHPTWPVKKIWGGKS